jgi:hypothetical protein
MPATTRELIGGRDRMRTDEAADGLRDKTDNYVSLAISMVKASSM